MVALVAIRFHTCYVLGSGRLWNLCPKTNIIKGNNFNLGLHLMRVRQKLGMIDDFRKLSEFKN